MFVECRACGKKFAGNNIYALLEEMNKHLEEHRIMGDLPAVITDELDTTVRKSNPLLYCSSFTFSCFQQNLSSNF